jgi:division protein 1
VLINISKTLSSHITPITALDISEPYGTLVSASQEDTQPRVWDLLSGEEIARLRGHAGTVKCVQVEDHVCLTGSEDCTIKLWDLRRVDDDDWHTETELPVGDAANDDGEMIEKPSGIRDSDTTTMGDERVGPLVRSLEGHSRAVTALYFEDDCLVSFCWFPMPFVLQTCCQVTGASDKTMRQWDLNTGQCVMTMDMLWAISHPQHVGPASEMSNFFPGSSASSGTFSVVTPPYADGSWEVYEDFVGALQFWEYALVSGSGDGAVRMWDSGISFRYYRTLLI